MSNGGQGSRRCSMCGICYPVYVRVCRVDICREQTSWFSNVEPDEDWEYAVRLANSDLAPVKEPTAMEIIELKAKVIERRGQLFVHEDYIKEVGRDWLPTLTLLQVGKQIFEVLGYNDEKREYWVRSFSMEPTDEDMSWLQRHEV